MDSKFIIETIGLTKHFEGLYAVNKVDFQVKVGELVGIIGPNGAGKTTFFNLLTGLFAPNEGEIYHFGNRITKTFPSERVLMGFARTFQLVSVFDSLKVLDNLVLANVRFGKDYKSQRRFFFKNIQSPDIVGRCKNALCIMGIEDKSNLLTAELSYGDKRKLEIAIALSLNPKVLLLDEPFAGLSDSEIDEVIYFINTEIKGKYTLIIIEHKISRIVNLVKRLSVMHEGRFIIDGKPNEVLNSTIVKEVYFGRRG